MKSEKEHHQVASRPQFQHQANVWQKLPYLGGT